MGAFYATDKLPGFPLARAGSVTYGASGCAHPVSPPAICKRHEVTSSRKDGRSSSPAPSPSFGVNTPPLPRPSSPHTEISHLADGSAYFKTLPTPIHLPFSQQIPGDYSKRVYQGVRVKHTVKDLLAEKRSRQTSNSRFNGGTNSSQSPFVQMPGSPATSGYYGVRRSFLSDSDFHNTKQFSNDGYQSSLAKPFSCESSTMQNYPPILDSYFSEPYGDYRPAALTPNTSSLFGASPLPPPLLQSHFPGDSTHFVFRDSWEQTVPDSLNQPDVVSSDPLQTLPAGSNCLSSQESGSPSQQRSSGWGAGLAGAQPYSLHALEDLHYTSGYPTSSSYSFTPFMTVTNDLTPKVIQLTSEESLDTTSLPENPSWTKEDGNGVWGSYECRRTY
ncbi:POU domain class 2-associating factor 2 [Petaurus breviceps papuanus]|uniref:POU domain class 2-associating factor 2 n=1 Tax=Petaurus breviceps papuanus TaxID=3040969 RepID=UPI0036DD3D7D